MSCTRVDEQLHTLPLPMRNARLKQTFSPLSLMGEGKVFGSGKCISRTMSDNARVECSLVDIGGLPMLSGRTTAIDAWEHDVKKTSMTICYSGSPRYMEERRVLRFHPGEVLMNPRNGGCISTGYLSSINVPLDHQRLTRSIRVMAGTQAESAIRLDEACIFTKNHCQKNAADPCALLSFVRFIDTLIETGYPLWARMGLEEQLYRIIAAILIESHGFAKSAEKCCSISAKRSAVGLDELVDYIRQNAHQALTLTDLEEQSHFSARHLQNLFRERFDCSPMQFVKRQRLDAAMQRLQEASCSDTVTGISREYGYCNVSNFTTDFGRQFGITPSSVLRASRGGGHQKMRFELAWKRSNTLACTRSTASTYRG